MIASSMPAIGQPAEHQCRATQSGAARCGPSMPRWQQGALWPRSPWHVGHDKAFMHGLRRSQADGAEVFCELCFSPSRKCRVQTRRATIHPGVSCGGGRPGRRRGSSCGPSANSRMRWRQPPQGVTGSGPSPTTSTSTIPARPPRPSTPMAAASAQAPADRRRSPHCSRQTACRSAHRGGADREAGIGRVGVRGRGRRAPPAASASDAHRSSHAPSHRGCRWRSAPPPGRRSRRAGSRSGDRAAPG